MEFPHQTRKLSKSSLLKVFQEVIDTVEQQDIPKIDGENLSYDRFFTKYMYPNRPVVLSNLLKNWNSVLDWKDVQSGVSILKLEHLKHIYGDCEVDVAHCETKQYTDQKRERMKFSKYTDYWQTLHNNPPKLSDIRLEQLVTEGNPVYKVLPKELLEFIWKYKKMELLYLKDWHLAKEHPNPTFYSLPLFFSDDWINTFWDTCEFQQDGRVVIDTSSQTSSTTKKDDYRFVYMGPKGTWTPFHADVFRSYSWSSNVAGRKLWIMFSPDQEKYFQDKFGNYVYDVTEVDLEIFPDFRKTKPVIVVQEEGETIFVPSGWFHQVYNLEDTISINHNWGNGCNIDMFWDYLQKEHQTVAKSIEDVKSSTTEDEFEEQCQLIMRCNTGIDYVTFYYLLFLIAQRELSLCENLENATDISSLDGSQLSCLFNMYKIDNVMRTLKDQRAIQIAFRDNVLTNKHCELLETIGQLVKKFCP